MRIQEAQKVKNIGEQIFVLILCTILNNAFSATFSVSEDARIEPRTFAKFVLGSLDALYRLDLTIMHLLG
jgi:hypothetical protein